MKKATVLKIDQKTKDELQKLLPFPKSGTVLYTPMPFLAIEDEAYRPVFVLVQPSNDDAKCYFEPAYKDINIDEAISKHVKSIDNVFDSDSSEFVSIPKDNISEFVSGLLETVKIDLFVKFRSLCRLTVLEKAGLGQ